MTERKSPATGPITSTARSWMIHAACRHTDPEIFFPTSHGTPGQRDIRTAKRVCRACPVIAECLAYADAHHERHGIWGGLTIDERRHRRQLDLTRR